MTPSEKDLEGARILWACTLKISPIDEGCVRAIATALSAARDEERDSFPLKIKVDAEGVWVTFETGTGLSASLEIGALAAKQGHGIIQAALEKWCLEQRGHSLKHQGGDRG